jgi:signal transduction histidine kinase
MNMHDDEPATSPSAPPPTLGDFILKNMDALLQDWEDYAQSLSPAAVLSRTALRDHAQQILEAIAADMARPQSSQAQEEKSKGLNPENSLALEIAGEQHGLTRILEQFESSQLISEFRALRASVLRRWTAAQKLSGDDHLEELTRFNESIDEALASSILHFSHKVDEARTVILGVLAHDLRNPLSAALMSASFIIEYSNESEKCIQSAARIQRGIKRCDQLVSDLLDYARAKLDHGIPMHLSGSNMRGLCSAAIDEVESAHPGRFITQSYSGDMNGIWDPERIAQLLANLLINALKHGRADTPVLLTASCVGGTVCVDIHNDGPAIRADSRAAIFDPLYMKGGHPGHLPEGSSGLGLGLYICREIALAHGGDIEVTSDPNSGTSFKVTLPQESQPRSSPSDFLESGGTRDDRGWR